MVFPFLIAAAKDTDIAREDADEGIPTQDVLMRQFSSLGDNCEPGMVHRQCDAEPLDLLRFSRSDLDQVIRAIDNSFADVSDIGNVQVQWREDEFFITQTAYNFAYHTFIRDGTLEHRRVQLQQSKYLKLLARKCLEESVSGERIFVRKGDDSTGEAQLLRLHDALRRHGKPWLLWIVPEDESHPGGTGEIKRPSLLKAYIERFAPYEDANNTDVLSWVEICCRAYIAVRQEDCG
jgi:hypothetical protein